MTSISTVLPAVLGLTCLSLAATIAFRPRIAGALPNSLPSGLWPRLAISLMAATAGAALMAGAAVPFLNFFASSVTALLAIVLLILVLSGPMRRFWLIPALLLVGSFFAGIAQPLGLKVILLPKADTLSYAPVPVTVVKTYDEGVWLESVRAGSDGTLYLSANRDLDFARADYYHSAQGEVIARRPDGSETVLFTTPVGSTAGVVAVALDGTLYVTSNGATSGIWRILPDGTNSLLTSLPRGAWPNGLAFGPEGMLYSADSNLGLIWRIDPASGKSEIATKDPALLARRFVALAPGANGIQFQGRDMIVTVSDATSILRFRMTDTGDFSAPEVVATGIPGDDFAIGKDGSLFVTTHPYNTVVRVAPDGTRTVVADAGDGVTGAVDAVFGTTDADRDTLYVATDGGAFTGGPTTRGALVALQPFAAK